MAATVVIKIIGNAVSGIAALKSVQDQLNKAAGASKALGAAFSALAAAGGSLIKSAVMTAARTQVLGTSLRVVAETAGITEDQIGALEEEVKGLGITTQNARKGLVRLIQANVDLSKATDLARVAQDLAVVAGENSSVTYDRLVTAIATMNPRLLRQVNIVANLNDVFGKNAAKLDSTTKRQMLMNFILKEGEKVAGVYESAMGDVGKIMGSTARLAEEAKNAFGEAFLPALKVVVEFGQRLLKFWNALPEPVQRTVALVFGAATAFAALMGPLLLLVGFLPTIASGFAMLISALPVLLPIIGAVTTAIGLLVAGVVVLRRAWAENWGNIRETVELVVIRIKAWLEPLVADIRFWLQEIKRAWDALIGALRPAITTFVNFLRKKLLVESGLDDFLSFLKDTLNVALGFITGFIDTLTGLIKGEEDAWDPLLDGLLNVITLIALAWEKWISKAVTWGWNLIVEFATGVAKAANQVLQEIISQIGSLIQSFLGAFSPPKKGPLARIVEWGRNLINEYVRGFTLADFGAIKDALAPIQQALESAVTLGDIDESEMVEIFSRVRGLAAELFSEFRRSGEISADVLNRISEALGEGAQDYVDYIRLTLEYQAALADLQTIEDEVAAARETGFVSKELQDSLDAAKEEVDAKKDAVSWQRELLAFQQDSVDIQLRMVEAMEDLTESLSGVVGPEGVGGLAEGLGELPTIAKSAESAVGGLKIGIGALSDEFVSMKERVREFFENLPASIATWMETVKTTISDKWAEIRENLSTTLLQIAGIFAGAFLLIHDKVKETLLQLAATILGALLIIRQWFVDKWEEIKTTVATAWDDIFTKVSDTLTQIAFILAFWFLTASTAISDWIEGVKTTLSDAWDDVVAKVGETWETIVTTISTWIDEAITTVTDAAADFVQAGADLINGLLDGLKGAWEGVKQWIGSRIEDLPQWIKDALNIASPPAWAIRAGQDIVEGLRQGLDLSALQEQVGATFNAGALGGGNGIGGGGVTVVFAEGAFVGAFPGVRDGRDASSVVSELQRLVEKGYLSAQVPGGVTA